MSYKLKIDYINNNCGIYKIYSKKEPEKFYIGNSLSIAIRRNKHFSLLKKGIHHSKYLQNYYNKYGENSLCFEIIEKYNFPIDYEVSLKKDYLESAEQHYINTLNPSFNMRKIVGHLNPRVVTEEEKIRTSNRHKNNSYCKGYKFTKQQLKNLTKKNKEKWDNQELRDRVRKLSRAEILKMYKIKIETKCQNKDLARQFNIDAGQVSKILRGHCRYSEFSEQVQQIEELGLNRFSKNKLNK